MKVIGYIRVSTSKQEQSGLSLEAQELKIRRYCELYDLELVDVVVDAGVTAANLKRDGIQSAIKRISSGEAEGLIIAKLDRLTRSIKDLNQLIEDVFTSAALISVSDQVDTNTPAGRLVLNILMSVAQWEREETAHRTATAMKVKKDKGEYTGGKAPLGWRVNEAGDEVPDEAEQELISIVRGYRTLRFSYSAIAQKLTDAEFTSRSGNAKFSKSMAKRINDAETTEERAQRLHSRDSA
jgi:site-specific DNA recombinase